jgi:hypothetical protein
MLVCWYLLVSQNGVKTAILILETVRPRFVRAVAPRIIIIIIMLSTYKSMWRYSSEDQYLQNKQLNNSCEVCNCPALLR